MAIVTLNGISWMPVHPLAIPDQLGFAPEFLSADDPRGAVEQLHWKDGVHGGGWSSVDGFDMLPNGNMKFPGDPETRLLYEAKLRDEMVRLYENAWIAVVQPDNSFYVSRLD